MQRGKTTYTQAKPPEQQACQMDTAVYAVNKVTRDLSNKPTSMCVFQSCICLCTGIIWYVAT